MVQSFLPDSDLRALKYLEGCDKLEEFLRLSITDLALEYLRKLYCNKIKFDFRVSEDGEKRDG